MLQVGYCPFNYPPTPPHPLSLMTSFSLWLTGGSRLILYIFFPWTGVRYFLKDPDFYAWKIIFKDYSLSQCHHATRLILVSGHFQWNNLISLLMILEFKFSSNWIRIVYNLIDLVSVSLINHVDNLCSQRHQYTHCLFSIIHI